MQPLEQRLAAIIDPATGQALSAGGARIRAAESEGKVAVAITLGYPAAGWRDALRDSVAESLASAGLALASFEL